MSTSQKPSTTDRPWLEEVLRADKEYYKKDIVYEWSNGRKFQTTDDTDKGVYDGS